MDYLSSASRFLEAEHTVEHKSFVTPSTTHAGAVVFEGSGDSLKFLLVKANDAESHWVLPKGHIENGEDAWSAALREVREETGVIAKRDLFSGCPRKRIPLSGRASEEMDISP
jgi:8-oxo-dGTP pyrophosphatase MutT (NUDIX family)